MTLYTAEQLKCLSNLKVGDRFVVVSVLGERTYVIRSLERKYHPSDIELNYHLPVFRVDCETRTFGTGLTDFRWLFPICSIIIKIIKAPNVQAIQKEEGS